MLAERAVGGGAAPGAAAFAQKHPWMCLCEGGGSTPAILRRESLSFHLRAHAMRTMEGRGDNARWVECELGCENISAQPLHLHPPPPSSRAVYEAMHKGSGRTAFHVSPWLVRLKASGKGVTLSVSRHSIAV